MQFSYSLKSCIFILFFVLSLQAQQYWLVSSTPTQQTLRSLFFADSLHGWAGGDSGVIVHTSDGGYNWQLQSSSVNSIILEIYFIDNQNGWALTWDLIPPTFGTIILRTTDGGINWNSEPYPQDNVFLRTIFFFDVMNGWMAGDKGLFIHTQDSGQNWTAAPLDSSVFAQFPVIYMTFFDAQLGFACGGAFDLAGVVWRTTNSGQLWVAQGVAPEPIQHLWMFDSLNILGVGGDYEFGASTLRTYNGGNNWQYTTLPTFGIARKVSFRTIQEGWAVLGLSNKYIVTHDTGETWQEFPAPDSTGVFDITFTDTLHGFTAGTEGKILRYNSFLATSPVLISPENGATGVSISPTFSWQALKSTDVYQFQVSTLPDFSILVINDTHLPYTFYPADSLSPQTTHYWRVRGLNSSGQSRWSEIRHFTTGSTVRIASDPNEITKTFQFPQNYPNPFNATTNIAFSIALPSQVRIEIFNISGQKIKTVLDKQFATGTFQHRWHAENMAGGVYLIQLKAISTSDKSIHFQQTRKVLLLK
jgi:photosystem II stability/assembly factor-like uncharacterized protein